MKKILSLAVVTFTLFGCQWTEKAKQSAENTAKNTIDATTQVYEETKNKVGETVDDVEKAYDSTKSALKSVDQAEEDVKKVFE